MKRNFIPIVPDVTLGAMYIMKKLSNPYPNEHAVRYQKPIKGAQYRRQNNKFGQGIHAIWMFGKGAGSKLQAIRLDAKRFTKAQARKIAAHFAESFGKPKEIEYATGVSKNPASVMDLRRKYRELVDKYKSGSPTVKDSLYKKLVALEKLIDKQGGFQTNPRKKKYGRMRPTQHAELFSFGYGHPYRSDIKSLHAVLKHLFKERTGQPISVAELTHLYGGDEMRMLRDANLILKKMKKKPISMPNPPTMYTAAQVKKMLKVLGFKITSKETTQGASKTWWEHGQWDNAKKALKQVLQERGTDQWGKEWHGKGFSVRDVTQAHDGENVFLISVYKKGQAGVEYSMGIDT
jgi:hypothetical protein